MITYTIADMILVAISAGTAAGLTAGLIVDHYRRRQQPQPEPQPAQDAAQPAPAAEPAQAADPYSPEARAQLRQALDALQQMQRSAHAYKALAEGLERSLATERAEAAKQEERIAALQYLHQQRTQEALAAGFTIVIDHGDLGRRHHPHREDPQQ